MPKRIAVNMHRGLPTDRRWKYIAGLPARLAILSLAFLMVAGGVEAQAQPPNRFYGSAKVNGQDQSEGTVVEAYVGNTLCGSGTVQARDGGPIYFLDVLGAGQKPNCAKDGDKVSFKIAGLDAKESGTYTTASATRLDLTANGTARQIEQPTVLAPGTGGTPPPPPTFTAVPTTAVPTLPPAPVSTAPATATANTTASPAPSGSETPTAAAGTPTVATSETPTETPSPASTPEPPETPLKSTGGPPAALWVVIVAIVLIGAGVAAWLVQRRRA